MLIDPGVILTNVGSNNNNNNKTKQSIKELNSGKSSSCLGFESLDELSTRVTLARSPSPNPPLPSSVAERCNELEQSPSPEAPLLLATSPAMDVDCYDFEQNEQKEEQVIKVLEKLKKWSKIQSVGQPVRGTRLIPCKTPVASRFIAARLDKIAGMEDGPFTNFDVEVLLQELERRGTPLGLIVDLSNHSPLYDTPLHGLKSSWRHVKVACVSKITADLDTVQRLRQVIRNFEIDPKNEGKYIAIHCSYGRNRTGVMVVSYLVEELGMSIEDALNAFREARSPGIKHPWMIQELRERYGSTSTTSSPSSTSSVSPAPSSPFLSIPSPQHR